MTNRIYWSKLNPDYEAGCYMGVFYPQSGSPEAWNGLVSVTEDAESDDTAVYVDGIRLNNRRTAKSFSGTISAMTYPEGFESEVYTARRPKPFGMTYRVNNAIAYQIHLLYNVLVAPSPVTRSHAVMDPFEWPFSTSPVLLPEGAMGSHLIVDPALAYPWAMDALNAVLYGTDQSAPRLPTPLEVFELFEENALLRVIDNGDGTFTVFGPDDAIDMLDADTFEISWPSAQLAPDGRFTIYSL